MKSLQERILKRHKRDKKTELKERLEAYKRRKEYARDYQIMHKEEHREINKKWVAKRRDELRQQGIKVTANTSLKKRQSTQVQMTKQRPDVRYYFEINHIPDTLYEKGAIIEARQLEHSKGVAFSITYLTKNKKWEIKSGEEVNDMINKGYIKYLKDYKHKPPFFQN